MTPRHPLRPAPPWLARQWRRLPHLQLAFFSIGTCEQTYSSFLSLCVHRVRTPHALRSGPKQGWTLQNAKGGLLRVASFVSPRSEIRRSKKKREEEKPRRGLAALQALPITTAD